MYSSTHHAIYIYTHFWLLIFSELLSQVKREVSFVHYLLLEICAIIVGWTYTIFWIVSYYPQVIAISNINN